MNIIISNSISIITATVITEQCHTTGDRCLISCAGLPNGVYQSCRACNVFITCVRFTPYTIQCPLGLVFDDNKKRCDKTSDTCLCLQSKYQRNKYLKGSNTEKLHAMHAKELIQTNYFER